MKVERLFNFYSSKFHLGLIILKYLQNKTKKITVITFIEDGLYDEIKMLNEKYKFNINEEQELNFKETKDIYTKEIKPKSNIIIVVDGNQNYIDEVNEYINVSIKDFKFSNIKIINCFNFNNQKFVMNNTLKKYDKILYTTGESNID